LADKQHGLEGGIETVFGNIADIRKNIERLDDRCDAINNRHDHDALKVRDRISGIAMRVASLEEVLPHTERPAGMVYRNLDKRVQIAHERLNTADERLGRLEEDFALHVNGEGACPQKETEAAALAKKVKLLNKTVDELAGKLRGLDDHVQMMTSKQFPAHRRDIDYVRRLAQKTAVRTGNKELVQLCKRADYDEPESKIGDTVHVRRPAPFSVEKLDTELFNQFVTRFLKLDLPFSRRQAVLDCFGVSNLVSLPYDKRAEFSQVLNVLEAIQAKN
jgi:hypothetical protein